MGCSNESENGVLDFNITEIDMIDTSVQFINENDKDIPSISKNVEVVNVEV